MTVKLLQSFAIILFYLMPASQLFAESSTNNNGLSSSVVQQTSTFSTHAINPNREQEAESAAETYQNISNTIKQNPAAAVQSNVQDSIKNIGFFGRLKLLIMQMEAMQDSLINSFRGKKPNEQSEQEKLDHMIKDLQQQQSTLNTMIQAPNKPGSSTNLQQAPQQIKIYEDR